MLELYRLITHHDRDYVERRFLSLPSTLAPRLKTFASRFFKAALYAVLYFSNAQSIASTDLAAQEDRNRLTTSTLTQSDIQNRADYRGRSPAIGGGYQVGKPTIGLDQRGRAQTGAGQVPGTALPTLGGFGAAPPLALSTRDSADSVTRSGVSPATIDITDEKKQQALTGKDAPTTIASINRDVSTDRDTSSALKPIFNEQEIRAGFAITAAFSREVGLYVNNQVKEAGTLRAQAAKESDPLKQQALLIQAYEQELKWGPGGTYRQITTAIAAAAAGNVTGSATQMLQSAAVNYLQSLGVAQVKQIADSLKDANGQTTATSETVRAALQALVACAGAAAQSQSCGAGALGASASVALNELLKPAQDSPAAQEARKNIAATLIGSIAAAAGANNIEAMVNASVLETDNNALNLPPATRRALGGALGVAASLGSLGEIVKPEFWRGLNALLTAQDSMGLLAMGIEQVVAERQGDYAMFERLNDEFGRGMVVGRNTADVLMLAQAVGAVSVLSVRLAQAGVVFVNKVRYALFGGKIVREAAADIAQAGTSGAKGGTAVEKLTGTVFDSIKATQPPYPGSVIPISFEMALPNGQRVWVAGNATDHLVALANRTAVNYTPEAVRLASQLHLSELQGAVNVATQGGIKYGELITIGRWELKFAPPKQAGQLPALIHAQPK